MEVSFIVPHKGREHFLRRTLASIAAQDSDRAVEVIVVTQNEALAPETLAAVADLPLRVLKEDTALTIAALRNLGVKESQAPYLAFLDADIELSTNWLRELLALLEDSDDIVLASAVQQSSLDAPPLEEIRTALSNARVDAAVDFLPGRNLLLTRAQFDAAGGFPEQLITCEDYVFTDRVGRDGKLWYSTRASYIHLGEDKRLDEMFQKEIWRGQSNLQSLRGRRVEPGEWPSFLVPPWICGCLFAALLLAVLGNPAPAIIAAILGLLPFAAYALRLYLLAEQRIALIHILSFYASYFPARAWGTLVGGFRSLGKRLHDQ